MCSSTKPVRRGPPCRMNPSQKTRSNGTRIWSLQLSQGFLKRSTLGTSDAGTRAPWFAPVVCMGYDCAAARAAATTRRIQWPNLKPQEKACLRSTALSHSISTNTPPPQSIHALLGLFTSKARGREIYRPPPPVQQSPHVSSFHSTC